MSPGRAGRTARRAVAGLMLAIAGVVLAAPLFRTPETVVLAQHPADGAALTGTPTAVNLRLSRPADPRDLHLTVTDSDGGAVTGVTPRIAGNDVELPLPPLEPGAYRVTYHAILTGGAVLTGTSWFSVDDPAATAAAPAAGHGHTGPVDPLTLTALAANVAALTVIAGRETLRRWRRR